jgi:hypothetical protein
MMVCDAEKSFASPGRRNKTGETKMTRGRTILAWLTAGAIGLAIGFASRQARADDLNACGCRQGSSGACYCEKKSHCGCPGECEPKGCEEKRAKQMEKEVQEETRKAEEAQRRQRARQESSDEEAAPRHEDRNRDERSHEERAREERAHEEHVAPAPKVHVVKMTPVQKRDLARLIKLYLAEHPDQGARPIGEVENDVGAR